MPGTEEGFFAEHKLDLHALLTLEIKRAGHTFIWRAAPRKDGPPELGLYERSAAGTVELLCSITPQKHNTTSRVYFEVVPKQQNKALNERGATFDRLAEAVSWCSANDWLTEPPAQETPTVKPQSNAEQQSRHNWAPIHDALRPSNGVPATEAVAASAPFNEAPQPPAATRPWQEIKEAKLGAERSAQIREEVRRQPFKPGTDVNHPAHYNMGSIEVIDALEAWGVGPHEFNVIKYVARAKHKGAELKDLEKALWYLQRKIALLGGVFYLDAGDEAVTAAIAAFKMGIYRHYKGARYQAAEIVRHHETRMPYVCYMPIDKLGAEWSMRPLVPVQGDRDAWLTMVVIEEKPGVRHGVPRFELIEAAITPRSGPVST